MSSTSPPKALLTDVFGTVVDWRSSVETHLSHRSQSTLSSDRAASLSSSVRQTASHFDWPAFAQSWRETYFHFTRTYTPVPSGDKNFKSVDQHYRDSLETLLDQHGLDGLWTLEEMDEISLIWHKLVPWDDSASGLGRLNEMGFVTATLSNGNTRLLQDLADFGRLPYKRVLGAEDFGAYKPHEKVYRGAAEKLGLDVGQCALVAAHLGDLKAARGCGYQTVYIERKQEEAWAKEEIEKARRDGWVDMWVEMGKGGFEEVARRFGQGDSRKEVEEGAKKGEIYEDASIMK